MSTTISIVVDSDTQFDLRQPEPDMFTHSLAFTADNGTRTTMYFCDESFNKLKEIINNAP